MLNYRNQLLHDIDESALPKVDKLELKINIIINVLNGHTPIFKVEYDRAIKHLREMESEYIKQK